MKKGKRGAIRKGYFIGIGIGIAVVVIAVLLLIGTTPQGAKASITLKDEQGNPLTASKIILDGTDLGSATGEVTPEVLDVGEHTIIIFWGGAKYTKTFYFSGEETILLIQLSSPIETRISVWNESLNQPIANVTVYVDGEVQGTTSADGLITVTLEPGGHTFRLLGSGVSHEEIRAVSAEANFVEFKVERTSVITISVSDELTGNPVRSAAVYFDGVYKEETPASGTLEIRDVKDGQHQIEVRYKNLSTEESIMVTQTATSFSLSIPVPRTVTLAISDEETGLPVSEMRVFIDGSEEGITTEEGEIIIEDILPGTHKAEIDVPGYIGRKEKYFDVGIQERIPLIIDMPNPEFQIAVSGESHWQIWYELGEVCVELVNVGNADSKSTIVLVLVYREDDLSNPIDSEILNFPSLVPIQHGGESETRYWNDVNFVLGPSEIIVTIVFDGWTYTPQNEQVLSQITVPSSMLAELTYSVTNYLKEHPEVIVNTIAKIVVAWWG